MSIIIPFMRHAHSGMRYIILLALVISIVLAIKGKISKTTFSKPQIISAKLSVIFVHLQLLIGLYLYFYSGKVVFSNMKEVMSNSMLRFFTVEHLTGMIIAIVLITIGNAKVKKTESDAQKHKIIIAFFSVALVLIFLSIPWAFMNRF